MGKPEIQVMNTLAEEARFCRELSASHRSIAKELEVEGGDRGQDLPFIICANLYDSIAETLETLVRISMDVVATSPGNEINKQVN